MSIRDEIDREEGAKLVETVEDSISECSMGCSVKKEPCKMCGPLWVEREEAKEILGLSEEEFRDQVMHGKILTHRIGKWFVGGRTTLYFVGSVVKKTEEFKLGDPEFVGEIPEVKMETIDAPSKKMDIGWTVSERSGWEVKVLSADFDQEIMKLETDEDKYALIHSCENLTDLREGKKVLVMSIMGWVMGEVRMSGEFISDPHVDSGGSLFPLLMCEDRKCWVTSSQFNKKVFGIPGPTS